MDCPYDVGVCLHAPCVRCGAHNRGFQPFCRACGAAVPAVRASQYGDVGASSGFPRLRNLRSLWEVPLPDRIAGTPLLLGRLWISVSRAGHVTVLEAASGRRVHGMRLQGVREVVAAPALLDGVLVVAAEHRLFAVDLLDALDGGGQRPSRTATLDLEGAPIAHVVASGRVAAVLTLQENRLRVSCFTLERRHLAALPTHSPWSDAPHDMHGAALVGDGDDMRLLVGSPDGRLALCDPRRGGVVQTQRIPHGLASVPFLSLGSHALLVDRKGGVWRASLSPGGLHVASLAEGSGLPVTGFGASREDAMVVCGDRVCHVHLASLASDSETLQQPSYQPPVVGDRRAVVFGEQGHFFEHDLSHGLRVIDAVPATGVDAPVLCDGARLLVPAGGGLRCLGEGGTT